MKLRSLIWQYSREIRLFQIFSGVLTVGSGLFLIFFTLYLSSFINNVSNLGSRGAFIQHFAVVMLLYSGVSILTVLSYYIAQIMTLKVRTSLWKSIYRAVTRGSQKELDRFDKGDLIARTFDDTLMLSGTISNVYTTVISQSILFVFYSYAIYLLSSSFLISFLLFIAVFAAIFAREGKVIPEKAQIERESFSKAMEQMRSKLENSRIIKKTGSVESMRENFESDVSSYYGAARRSISAQQRYNAYFSYAHYVSPLILMGVAFYFYSLGTVSIGAVIAFYFLSTSAYVPIVAVSGTISSYYLSKPRFSRFIEVVDVEEEESGKEHLDRIESVEIRDVDFSYGDKSILHDIALSVNKGSNISITGESGEGKSTLVSLLNRLNEPTAGSIMINGKDSFSYDLLELRRRLIVVSGSDGLFKDTLRNNITLNEPFSDEDVKGVMEICGIDFLESLDITLDSSTVSDGERQRIGLARAIIRKPELLVLDEALSGVDSTLEEKIVEGISAFLAGCTLIVISHRLSTLLKTPSIYLLKGGTFVCSGGIESLRSHCPEFDSLMSRQIIL